MDFDAIMTEITSGLTDDPKKDIQYLLEESEKYKDHEMSKEILRAVGRLIADRIPEDMKKELDGILEKEMVGHEAFFEEVDFCVYRKEYDKALSLLEPLVKKTKGMFEDDSQSEYHYFDEPFEEMLYLNLMNPQKDIRRASFPFTKLYIRRAGILYEMGRHEEAVQSCETALKWNPVHAGVIFELAENKKMLGDLDSYFSLTRDAFKKVFRPRDLAHCYRNMAYWFVEQELYREAMGCLLISLQYEDHRVARTELLYIQSKAGSKIKPPTEKQFEAVSKKYGFPIGPDKDVVGLAFALGSHCFEDKVYDGARYYWMIVNDLVQDEDLAEMINNLPEE